VQEGSNKMARVVAALCVVAGLLVSAAVAGAEVVPRLADLESPTGAPYDFDQVSKRCPATVAARDTSESYSGNASLRVQTRNDPACGGAYARGIFQANGDRHLGEGDNFWYGAAIYLPPGFYSAHTGYTDLVRIDSYVRDDSSSTSTSERAEINLASWSRDDIYLRAARGGTERTLVGPISPSRLSEGSWHWVEVHVRLSQAEGAAYTELKIDGRTLGFSRVAVLFAGAAPLNRLRYGIVSTAYEGSGNITAFFDRASISNSERGPLLPGSQPPPPPPPSPEPGPLLSRISLWRLNEAGGTVAADAMGNAPGVYVNGPDLGVAGIVNGWGTAVHFDGADDHVAIAARPALNVPDAVTLEAWFEADRFQGSLMRRNNSYELRAQGNGSALFRVWIDGAVRSLETESGLLSAGDVHHLVGTYDGESMKVYLDGTVVASRAQSGPISHGGNPLYLGRNDYADTFFPGVIDEVSIYSDALGTAAVLDRYQRGNKLGGP